MEKFCKKGEKTMLVASSNLEFFRDRYLQAFKDALELAIAIAGGVAALSKDANIDYATIHRWRGGNLGRNQPHEKLINYLKKHGE